MRRNNCWWAKAFLGQFKDLGLRSQPKTWNWNMLKCRPYCKRWQALYLVRWEQCKTMGQKLDRYLDITHFMEYICMVDIPNKKCQWGFMCMKVNWVGHLRLSFFPKGWKAKQKSHGKGPRKTIWHLQGCTWNDLHLKVKWPCIQRLKTSNDLRCEYHQN